MPKQKLDTPMVEKIRVEQPEEESDGTLSMIVGTVLVALGILLFVVGIVMFVLYYLPPREDSNVKAPVLYELPSSTNKTKISISGESEHDKVMIWVNDELVSSAQKVENKKFNYDYSVTKEGTYKIEVASIKGFPIRIRSVKTSPVLVAIDWTAPSKNVSFVYDKEVDTKKFSMSGTIDPNTKIILKKDGKEYSATSDSNGKFVIKDIVVNEGSNEFTAMLEDMAGNSTRVDNTVKVIYAAGDIDGKGATDLPESAGIFDNQFAYIFGNKLFTIFGLLAFAVLGINTSIVIRKLRKVNA